MGTEYATDSLIRERRNYKVNRTGVFLTPVDPCWQLPCAVEIRIFLPSDICLKIFEGGYLSPRLAKFSPNPMAKPSK